MGVIRPFRVWDSTTLQDNIKNAVQIRDKINTICTDNKVTPLQLPNSLVPSAHLYDLSVAFIAMYEKLLDYDLVKTGNLKSNRNNIH